MAREPIARRFGASLLGTLCLTLGLSLLAEIPAVWARPSSRAPVPREEEASPLAEGLNKAAWELWGLRPMGDRGACFCPLGLSESLGLLEVAAQGATAEEVPRWYSVDTEDYERELPSLFYQLRSLSPTLSQLNWLWYRDSLKLLAPFKQKMSKVYGAHLESVDFSRPRTALARINTTVHGSFRGRVRDFLTESDVNAETQIVMSNLVNFEGEWARPFAKKATRVQPFASVEGPPAMVPMMHQTGEFPGLLENRGVATEAFNLLELPYRDKRLALDLFVPSGDNTVAHLEQTLNFEKITGYLKRLDEQVPELTAVSLPRMQIKARGELRPQLEQLGLTNLFSPQADMSRMVRVGKGVRVSGVLQQVNLSINEVGSHRAAAAFPRKERPTGSLAVPFTADRPFLFLVRDKRTGLVVFIGRYCGPSSAPRPARGLEK